MCCSVLEIVRTKSSFVGGYVRTLQFRVLWRLNHSSLALFTLHFTDGSLVSVLRVPCSVFRFPFSVLCFPHSKKSNKYEWTERARCCCSSCCWYNAQLTLEPSLSSVLCNNHIYVLWSFHIIAMQSIVHCHTPDTPAFSLYFGA